jgi:hypothetical protein
MTRPSTLWIGETVGFVAFVTILLALFLVL